jgi:putative flippase GtrA
MNGLIIKKRLYSYYTQLKGIKIFGFGIVKAIGFGLDIGVFILFLRLGFKPLMANISAGIVSVTFNYFVSARYIFYYKSIFLLQKFLFYLIWNAFRIVFFSFIIAQTSIMFSLFPIIPKIIVSPLPFYCDFLFMSFLMTGKVKYY